MIIRTPSILAQLPRALDITAGETAVGEVHSLVRSRKRKRYEVAAAVDGEGVNIYNVQSPKLVTSYAVPPQSSFTCPPCSVRTKFGRDSAAQRSTYCALQRPETQIQCFSEESIPSFSTRAAISTTTHEIKDTDSPIILLDVVPQSREFGREDTDRGLDLIAVHRNGLVRRLAGDLREQKWCIESLHQISNGRSRSAPKSLEIRAAFILSVEDARKCLLKKREDILMALSGGDETAGDGHSILILVTQTVADSDADFEVHTFSTPHGVRSKSRSTHDSQRLTHWMTAKLPSPSQVESQRTHEVRFAFHAPTGILYQKLGQGVVCYDLTHYSPRIHSQLILDSERFSSLLRLSRSSILTATTSALTVFDTQYRSIQASLSLHDVSFNAKSKTMKGGQTPQTTLLSYFAKLNIVVALQGTMLVAFEIGSLSEAGATPWRTSRNGLLIESIGHGIGSVDTPKKKRKRNDDMPPGFDRYMGDASTNAGRRWIKSKGKLDTYAKAGDIEEFESLMAIELSKEQRSDQSLHKGKTVTASSEALELPPVSQFVEPEKVAYLISKIFSLQPQEQHPERRPDRGQKSLAPRLNISFFPPTLFLWLIMSKKFSVSNIASALRHTALPHTTTFLPTVSIIQALVDFDPTLHWLRFVLKSPVYFEATELVHAVRLLVIEAITFDIDDQPKYLTNTPDDPYDKSEAVDHDMNENKDLAPGQSNSPISSSREPISKRDLAAIALNHALTKLHSHPLLTITVSLRSILSHPELLALIHHLRVALATGGWTSRFTEHELTASLDPHSPTNSPTLKLTTISEILSCVIDAVGAGGWLASSTGPEYGAEEEEGGLIADIKAEISAALEGIQESVYLKGLLREFLRYGNSATSSSTSSATRARDNLPKRFMTENHGKAQILTLVSNNDEPGGIGDATMLPLSLKPSPGAPGAKVSKTKLRKGTGEVLQRSKREIKYLKHRAVGKYSFERIVI